MDNQHAKITGYRDLTQAEIDLMNEIKAHGQATEKLLGKVNQHIAAQYMATQPKYGEPEPGLKDNPLVEAAAIIDTPEEVTAKRVEADRLNACVPGRWHAIAKTHMQQGFMALVRAVAQPSTF